MKLHYYPETDSLCVEFQRRPSVDTHEIAPDVRHSRAMRWAWAIWSGVMLTAK